MPLVFMLQVPYFYIRLILHVSLCIVDMFSFPSNYTLYIVVNDKNRQGDSYGIPQLYFMRKYSKFSKK